jgi:hypothetical protein
MHAQSPSYEKFRGVVLLRRSAEFHSLPEFGHSGCAQDRDAEGVTHISPGQRPGNRVVDVDSRPKACLISAFGARLRTQALMNRAVGARPGFLLHFSWGVAPGWYELTPLASPEERPSSTLLYRLCARK